MYLSTLYKIHGEGFILSKKTISITTTFILLFTLIFSAIPKKAWAYENPSYYRDLKVQLKSMSSASMTLTLNGNYKINGNILSSGTVLSIVSGASDLLVDGISYGEVELVPENHFNTIRLHNGTRALSYLGTITLKPEASKIMAYNTIDMESYLKGVVPFEMSDYYPAEALKAQAIAARNFALKKMGTRAAAGYDFDDTILFQVYGGYNPNYINAFRAVEATCGMVLLYNSSLVEALYSSSNGGYTEAAENVWGNHSDYLISRPDPYENELWPNGDILLSNQQIETALKSKGYLSDTDTFAKIDIASITKFESGRVSSLPVIYKNAAGDEAVRYFTKDSARTFLALPSSLYSISYDEAAGIYTFSGNGYGHGLGMSQIGAKYRAQAGQSFEEILKFYYAGTHLEIMPPRETNNDTGTGGTDGTQVDSNTSTPEVKLLASPNSKYSNGDTISLTAASLNYKGNVEYRVIIYNGTSKVSTQLYNTPSTGYYNSSLQQAGDKSYIINIPTKNMAPGPYSITILVRKAGTKAAYDSFVTTNSFMLEAVPNPSRGGTTSSLIPKLSMITPPNSEYKTNDTISFTVSSPNYGGKVEYRVILYNGTTKTTSELWKTPSTGYYYKNWQPSGSYKFTIHWPVTGMKPGPYSMTVLVRRVGAKVPYDSFVKTETVWIR